MIKEAYVSYEVAELLKEKGFDVPCFDFYVREYEQPIKKHSQRNKPIDWNNEEDEDCFSASTHQMALAWLREEKNISISILLMQDIIPEQSLYYSCTIHKITSNKTIEDAITWLHTITVKGTYEEATEAALKYSLENLV